MSYLNENCLQYFQNTGDLNLMLDLNASCTDKCSSCCNSANVLLLLNLLNNTELYSRNSLNLQLLDNKEITACFILFMKCLENRTEN